LLSGFLATFSSTVNGGAAYLVKDIYQRYVNPNANQSRLIYASYVASALLIVTGVVIARFGTSINTAFMWIFGTLAAGILPPNVLRWYWWRLNGWGYAAGIFGGMGLSLGQVVGEQLIWHAPLPLYVGFPIIALASTVICLAVALLTQPTDRETLSHFYQTVQPAGAWEEVKQRVLAANPSFRREAPFSRDALNTLLALVAICALYVGTLYLVLHRYGVAVAAFGTTLAMCVGLFFTWYRNLPPTGELRPDEQDENTPSREPIAAEST